MLGGGPQNSCLSLLQITSIIYTHYHVYAAQRIRGTVDDAVAHDNTVGQDDLFIVRRVQSNLHHFDFSHGTFETVDFDEITNLKRTEQDNQHAGGKVRQLVFQRQSHRQARTAD